MRCVRLFKEMFATFSFRKMKFSHELQQGIIITADGEYRGSEVTTVGNIGICLK